MTKVTMDEPSAVTLPWRTVTLAALFAMFASSADARLCRAVMDEPSDEPSVVVFPWRTATFAKTVAMLACRTLTDEFSVVTAT